MTVYAISDLHLPAREKPMDIFGPQWENHFSRIREDWQNKVQPEDVVLLPGDLTWSMHLEEAKEDIARVGELPGRKILLRGNHDYWWSAIGRVRRALPEGMYALQNDSLLLDGVLFAGSRGWTLPPYAQEENDLRIYERERLRLEMSLKDARKRDAAAPLIPIIRRARRIARVSRIFWSSIGRMCASMAICTPLPSWGEFAAGAEAFSIAPLPATGWDFACCKLNWNQSLRAIASVRKGAAFPTSFDPRLWEKEKKPAKNGNCIYFPFSQASFRENSEGQPSAISVSARMSRIS